MSIPHSKVLSVTKGFGAVAQLHNNSPTSTQVVNVNINKENNSNNSNSNENSNKNEMETTSEVYYPTRNSNPYNNLVDENNSENTSNCNNESKNNNSQLEEQLKYKDNVIEALSSLLKIVESNPLIVNKYIIASLEDLNQLIKLLTDANEVHINTNNDVECTCIPNVKFVAVEKIYILKGDETLNFKYSFPEANKILDDHHVSVKLVKV